MNAPISSGQLRALIDMPLNDPDPTETAEWRESFASLAEAHGPGTRALDARRAGAHRTHAAHRLAARAGDAVRQHHRRRGAAGVPGRPRDRGAAGLADALECARDGGARQPGLRRARRPHRELCERGRPVRSRLQSFLPCAQRRASRRPGVLPAAQRAGRLCARLSRRALERRRPAALPPGTHRAGLATAAARAASAAIRIRT